MAVYDFKSIEKKWQNYWEEHKSFEISESSQKPKFYALDMFPYPSGAGLHVGHPLGYIASDIVSRYKRLNGFNVLHPMGFDAFGLPAEQYAVQTGQHPAITTAQNIERYKEQLGRIGFSFDWSREVQTCDPNYYKWTQWIFSQLFNSWYNSNTNRAENIDQLISIFEIEGNVNVAYHGEECAKFTSEDWDSYSPKEKENILQAYRLAFLKETTVNWCPELGTVLANEEVKDGLSERGGYPVVQKKMTQWYLRITAYADRLLKDLEALDWSDSLKEMQRNWIGKSVGAELKFKLKSRPEYIEVFTTRPDTIFGASFMVLAPEHELVQQSTAAQQKEVMAYVEKAKNKSERERMMNKEVSGVFTGLYALNPFNQKELPVYVAEYVLSGYGTGAIMAVPAHDERDHAFASKYKLDIVQVIESAEKINIQEESYDAKTGRLINSEFINGLNVQDAIRAVIQLAEEKGFGEGKTNFKLRDAGFSRQRYWGEPFPIIYKDGIPTLDTNLPLVLPEVESYKPTGTGESPLAAVTDWVHTSEGKRETDTMPGWAGSSWYFLRYMDPKNEEAFANPEKLDYWNQVDLYIGGTEHATGHLLYSRFWTKFLFDIEKLNFNEPFKKLVNQGMIQGESKFIYQVCAEKADPMGIPALPTNIKWLPIYVSADLMETENSNLKARLIDYIKSNFELPFVVDQISTKSLRISSDIVKGNNVDTTSLQKSWEQYKLTELLPAHFLDNGKFLARTVVEKMSKSKFNVVNPDDVCDEYGADTLRLYEMFLGPLQDSKPWSTQGIDGTHRFLKKLWALFYSQEGEFKVNDSTPTADDLKILHKTIKKINEDINEFSFNTSVSQFMICVNELNSNKCESRLILEPLLIILSPFAPHISEELFEALGNSDSILDAEWPALDESLLVENTKVYPISINGKTRTQIELPLSLGKEEIEKEVMKNEIVQKWLDGNTAKKVIVVPGRIVNIVL